MSASTPFIYCIFCSNFFGAFYFSASIYLPTFTSGYFLPTFSRHLCASTHSIDFAPHNTRVDNIFLHLKALSIVLSNRFFLWFIPNTLSSSNPRDAPIGWTFSSSSFAASESHQRRTSALLLPPSQPYHPPLNPCFDNAKQVRTRRLSIKTNKKQKINGEKVGTSFLSIRAALMGEPPIRLYNPAFNPKCIYPNHIKP
jgi:hypothetical protein